MVRYEGLWIAAILVIFVVVGYLSLQWIAYAPPTPTARIHVVAAQWSWDPNRIEVKRGDVIELTLTSKDVTHAFFLPDFGINIQVVPGYEVKTTFVADRVGEFTFRCAEYCGVGHHLMIGTLIVKA